MPADPPLQNTRVAIGIVIDQGRILICQRKAEGTFAGLWEFPGGKCEAGETPAECVVRELAEEVDLKVTPVRVLERIEFHYPKAWVTLFPFICRRDSGQAKAISAAQARWVFPSELAEYRFPEANDDLLKRLAAPGFIDAIDLTPSNA